MATWNEQVDAEFAGSWDEIEAFKVWINFDAADNIVLRAMGSVMTEWMSSARREQARARVARAIEEEGR